MKDPHSQVSDDERVLRRVHQEHYKPALERPIAYAAFRPTDQDADGISLFREQCGATPEQVAAIKNPEVNYIARLTVADIIAIEVDGTHPTVIATPHLSIVPGHASIPELNVKLRDGNKPRYRKLAQALANLAIDIVYRPQSRN